MNLRRVVTPRIRPTPPTGLHYPLMRILWLAQILQPKTQPADPGAGLFSLLLISALLGIGLLVLIGLIVAWRNYIQRQQELEIEHEERMADLPHPDAWSTSAQRIDTPDAEPSEAHIAQDDHPNNDFTHQDDPDEDEDDDFPFDLNNDDDNDDDNDGPIGRA